MKQFGAMLANRERHAELDACASLRGRGDRLRSQLAALAADEVTAHAGSSLAMPRLENVRLVVAVGKPFKPELRRRAAEDVAREVLEGRASAVTGRLADGQAIVVSVRGVDERTLQAALGGFSFAWEVAGPPA